MDKVVNDVDEPFLTYNPIAGNVIVNEVVVNGTVSTGDLYVNGSSIDGLPGAKVHINNHTFTGTVAGITKSMIILSNVDNTTDANKPVSTATPTALNLKANLANPTFTGTVSGITKSMVVLSNVDNTSDSSKVLAKPQITNLTSDLTTIDSILTAVEGSVGGSSALVEYADDFDARAGGVLIGGSYKTNDMLRIISLYDYQVFYDLGNWAGGVSLNASLTLPNQYTVSGWYYHSSLGSEPTYFIFWQTSGGTNYSRFGLTVVVQLHSSHRLVFKV